MKILISTVYEPFTNLGSFLQTYALYSFLKKEGHEVAVIENIPLAHSAWVTINKINPKRQFFLRLQKTVNGIKDIRKLSRVSKQQAAQLKSDVLICGSDEIWNLDNPYFNDLMFWGGEVNALKKIAFAVSVGTMSLETLKKSENHLTQVLTFDKYYPRDEHTMDILQDVTGLPMQMVGDPTLLVPVEELSIPIGLPNRKYLLVYSYGLSNNYIGYIKRFAQEHDLIIVSPCFWHLWADKVIECSALQFSSLMKGAAYVFTTTFHGAIFALLNHTRCAILPIRPKVRDIVLRLNCESRIINQHSSYEEFSNTLLSTFDKESFECALREIRQYSKNALLDALRENEKK